VYSDRALICYLIVSCARLTPTSIPTRKTSWRREALARHERCDVGSARRNSGRILNALRGLGIGLCGAFSTSFAQPLTNAPHLSAPHSRSITESESLRAIQAARERKSYEFTATAGQTYVIEVDQQGLDFIVTVAAPAGVERAYNSPLERDGQEIALFDAVSGTYVITVHSVEPTDAIGHYTLRVSALPTLKAPASRLAAMRLMAEAAAANVDATAETPRVMLAAYTGAAEFLRTEGGLLYAQALYGIAMTQYWHVYDMNAAADSAAKAAAVYRQLSEAALEANTVSLQAAALIETADYPGALELLEHSLAIHQRLGRAHDVSEVLYRRALTKYQMGEVGGAVNDWTAAAVNYKDAGDWGDELRALQQIAVVDANAGNYRSAIERLEHIVGRLAEHEDPNLLARCLDVLGSSYRQLGRAEDALAAFATGLSVHRQLGDQYHAAESLRGLGNTFFALGELDNASQYFQLALDEQSADSHTHAAALTGLGDIAFLHTDYERAIEYHHSALSITEAPHEQAYRQILIARDLNALGRHSEALATAGEARLLTEEHTGGSANLAHALTALGEAHLGLRQTDAAKTDLADALAKYEALRVDGPQADVLAALAATSRATGDLTAAAAYGAQAIEHVEQLRAQVSAATLRTSLGVNYRRHYDAQVEFQMDLAKAAADPGAAAELRSAALTTSERARSRTTLDLISEATAHLRRGVDQELMLRQQALRDEFVELGTRRTELLAARATTAGEATLEQLNRRMLALETELSLLETELRNGNSRYADFVYAEPLNAQELQRELVDSDTVLLQYSFGQQRSFVWVVTPTAIRAIELADRATIETAARRALEKLQAYRADSASQRALDGDLLNLSRHVLKPVAEFLGAKRVLVALDGALQYIPFSVLPLESAEGSEPLVTHHEVIAVPSLSVVTAQRQRSRPTTLGEKKTIAVFADPIMDAGDSRLAANAATAAVAEPSGGELLLRSPVSTTSAGRLPGTALEAAAIAELVPESSRLVFTGAEASRSRLLDTDLTPYRYLHLATHGFVDSRYPQLSSLLFSQFDESGQRQEGHLRLRDIYNLELDAELVVLSACDTALGKEIVGEGLNGMTQAFLYAGARSLLISLWKVDDRATKELMTRFYRGLLLDELHPAEALRQAQLSLAAERRFSQPFFWAGFVLSGDWR